MTLMSADQWRMFMPRSHPQLFEGNTSMHEKTGVEPWPEAGQRYRDNSDSHQSLRCGTA